MSVTHSPDLETAVRGVMECCCYDVNMTIKTCFYRLFLLRTTDLMLTSRVKNRLRTETLDGSPESSLRRARDVRLTQAVLVL